MHWIYRNRLAGARSSGRKIYDQLMSAAPHGLCVYCRYGQAVTLDHFLPKATFAALSIEPWNLIPSCQQCNHRLGDSWNVDADAEMLHPYFMPDLGRWLRAEVERTTPVVVTFSVDPAPMLDPRLARRIDNQFESLGLAELYSVVSSQELSSLERRLPSIFNNEVQVRAHLLEIAATALALDPNDRRGVMYEALGRDEWYCACEFVRAA